MIGAVVAAACSGPPTKAPVDRRRDERGAGALLGVQQHEPARADGHGGVGHRERGARGDARAARRTPCPAARVAARTRAVLGPGGDAPCRPTRARGAGGRRCPSLIAGATRTGVQTPPLAQAEVGESASRAVATRSQRRRIPGSLDHGRCRVPWTLGPSCVASARGTSFSSRTDELEERRMGRTIGLTVNGRRVEGDVEPRLLLVQFLRDAARAHGHARRLRHVLVRRLHGAHRRRGREVVHRARGAGRRQRGDHDRGPRAGRRAASRCSGPSTRSTRSSAATARRA